MNKLVTVTFSALVAASAGAEQLYTTQHSLTAANSHMVLIGPDNPYFSGSYSKAVAMRISVGETGVYVSSVSTSQDMLYDQSGNNGGLQNVGQASVSVYSDNAGSIGSFIGGFGGQYGSTTTGAIDYFKGADQGMRVLSMTGAAMVALNANLSYWFVYENPQSTEPLAGANSDWYSGWSLPTYQNGGKSGTLVSNFTVTNLADRSWSAPSWTYRPSWTSSMSYGLALVGTPVPEPSTYGLALGGLALVGAVIRRRRKA